MKENIKKIIFTSALILVVLFQFTFMANATDELSNTLICWGLKRSEEHSQAILDSDSLEVLNKYNRNCNGKRRFKFYISYL